MTSSRKQAAAKPAPASNWSFDPNRLSMRPVNWPMPTIVTVEGARKRPAATTEAPRPYPVLLGSWTNCGMRMNDEYIPTPTRNATRLVVHTPWMRIIRMSTSGSGELTSSRIQKPSTTMPTAIPVRVLPEPQPQVLVSLIEISTITRPADISAAAFQLMCPGDLIGDSGTNTWVAMVATMIATSGSQNSQW